MKDNAAIFMTAFKKFASLQLPIFTRFSNESIQSAFSTVWDSDKVNNLWLALLKDKIQQISNGKVSVELLLPDDSLSFIQGPFIYFQLVSGNKVVKVVMIKEIQQVAKTLQPFMIIK